VFFRILQFFSFSPKLSGFTEIMVAARRDIALFLLMFTVILLSYTIMGFLLYGEFLEPFTEMVLSIMELFKFMNFEFDYD